MKEAGSMDWSVTIHCLYFDTIQSHYFYYVLPKRLVEHLTLVVNMFFFSSDMEKARWCTMTRRAGLRVGIGCNIYTVFQCCDWFSTVQIS